MTVESAILQRLFDARKHDQPWVLLFDYDGTLAPYSAHPSTAKLPPETRSVLAQLRDTPGVFAGVLSGRPLADVRRMVGLKGLYYSGSGGMELDLLGVEKNWHDHPDFRERLHHAHSYLTRIVERYPGVWIETKPFSRTIHFRSIGRKGQSAFLREMNGYLQRLESHFRAVCMAQAFEISPIGAWNKGDAVRWIVEDACRDGICLYAGDERNDQDAFEMVRSLGGVTIGVGPNAPQAEYRLGAPQDLTAFLRRVAHQASC